MKAPLHVTCKRAYTPARMTPQITKAQAVEAYGGNASALARDLKVTPQAIYQWPDGPIAEGYALKLAFVLKPDVFGPGAAAAAPEDSCPAHGSRAGWEEGRPANANLVDDPVAAAPAERVA